METTSAAPAHGARVVNTSIRRVKASAVSKFMLFIFKLVNQRGLQQPVIRVQSRFKMVQPDQKTGHYQE
ncbi:hypothetical protein DRQ50_00165 [bacterium]|nr:MAG: hypothetical protein DRQ50_00165 [bacterium]